MAQFGPQRIILVGFDMRLDLGLHWHGRHDRVGTQWLNNPTDPVIIRWRKVMNNAAPVLSEMGIEVLNVSPVSALTAYPIVDATCL